MTGTQLRALTEYGKLMGWNVKNKVAKPTGKNTPSVADDLLARMSEFPDSEPSGATH